MKNTKETKNEIKADDKQTKRPRKLLKLDTSELARVWGGLGLEGTKG